MAITNISVFRSTDGGMTQAGAATGRMSGTAGDRLGLLNTLLLTGYNWQEVTASNLTQSGNIASLTLTGHGFNKYQRLWCIGMDQQGYLNGATYGDALYPSTVADANTLTFAVTGGPASPATAGGSTTLNGAISSTTATSVTVTSGASFPNFPFVAKVDSEYLLVTAGFQTTTWTVVRGFAGSTAATHSNGATAAQKILIGVAPAGGFNHWTADYTATNKSTFRPPAGNRFWLDLDDTNTTYGLLRSYESMTAVATGTNAFPTTGQVAAGSTYFASSATASTAARPWIATATDRWVYVWTDVNNTGINQNSSGGFFFGDLISVTKAGDAYATLLIHGSNSTGSNDATLFSNSTGTSTGHWMPRAYTQLGTSVQCAKYCGDTRSSGSYLGAGGLTFPHPTDGGLYIAPVYVNDGSIAVSRGTIPAFVAPLHAQPVQTGDIIVGTGAAAGRVFIGVKGYSTAQTLVEISNTIQAT